jgi:FtsH-binding integral membrane protein
MFAGIGEALGALMSYPVLIICVIAAAVSITLLAVKGKTFGKEVKLILTVLAAVAVAIVLFLIITAFLFGSNQPGAAPTPVPLG